MFLWKTIDIADTQRALLYRRGRLAQVLSPGRHRIQRFKGKFNCVVYDITNAVFADAQAKFLMNTYADKLAEFIEQIDIAETEVGLLYRQDRLTDVLAPGAQLFVWKGVEKITVERIDISEEFRIDEKHLGLLARGLKVGRSREVVNAIQYTEVPDEFVGLLFVNGKFVETLEPGSYGFWKYNRSITVRQLDLRLQTAEVSGQEILTKDRVSLRINLSASFRIAEALTVAMKLNDYSAFIYRELQLRLREAVGTKTLDELLEDKNILNQVISEEVQVKLEQFGINLLNVGVKDIVLPGEMKVILNQVVEAQKVAEANLIKRREETQAMRSLHNTAKMMENNPVLLRLKELEALEQVTQRIDRISVYSGLDGVLNDLVKLRA